MKQEPNKCCGAFYGCDKCKNKQVYLDTVYLDKLAENYLMSSVERNQYGDELSFIDGYKLAQKTLYSEEEVIAFGEFIFKNTLLVNVKGVEGILEQFKKK